MPTKPRMIPCPACRSEKSFSDYSPASFLRGDQRTIKECGLCGLSILWPLPTLKELNTYYNQGYYNFNRHSEEGKGFYWSRLLSRIQPKGRILDIGCATGFFLSGIRQHCDWEVHGQEMGKAAAVYARKTLGIPVKDVPLEKARYPKNYFDFIHFNNVLEHVTHPDLVMAEVGRILKPGGAFTWRSRTEGWTGMVIRIITAGSAIWQPVWTDISISIVPNPFRSWLKIPVYR